MSGSNASPGFRPLQYIGPGLVIAATGVGAGDLIAAAVSGSRFGHAVAWAALAGALLKFAMNEGIARWQLVTGVTLLEGWTRHLGRGLQWIFAGYLVIWSFIVAGALMAACGLAAHALVPALSVEVWAAIHSLVAAVLVLVGGYSTFEKLIGIFIAVMFATLIGAAVFIAPPSETVGRAILDAGLPPGSGAAVLGVIGGVGGSVTLLSYGYWIRERGWRGAGEIRRVRIDLGIAYGLTGLFGLAVILLAAQVLYGREEISGSKSALVMAEMLAPVMGEWGRKAFLVGFWGAVATSMLGVWQGVPYLFADFVRLRAKEQESRPGAYRAFLVWLALPPMLTLFWGKPVAMVMIYAISSALFMPFLAGTLLYLNSQKRWLGEHRSGFLLNGLLVAGLLLFLYLAGTKIVETFSGG